MTIKKFAVPALVAAALASSLLPLSAQACVGCNIKFNGISLNGLNLNGAQPNGVVLNGVVLNGRTFNGWTLNGWSLNGWELNGITLQGLPMAGFTDNQGQSGRPVAVTLPNGRVVPVR